MAGRCRGTSTASGEQQIVFAHSFRQKKEGFPLSGDPFLLYPVSVVYQWGRKDAFPGADGSTITATTIEENNAQTILIYDATGNKLTEGTTGVKSVDINTSGVLNGNTSQVYTIKNPLSFVYNLIGPWDWYTNTDAHNDALWGDNAKKIAYDPCPNDWHMPSRGTWNDLSSTAFPYYIGGEQISSGDITTTNGRLYNVMAWFPATGHRYRVSGALTNVGSIGCYWSSSVSGTNAIRLRFNMSVVNLNSPYYRAYGYPVRCVQE